MNFTLILELLSEVITIDSYLRSVIVIFARLNRYARWLLVYATGYDNGDETDSWCDTFTIVPKSIVSKTLIPLAYGNCFCDKPNILLITDAAKSLLGNNFFHHIWFFYLQMKNKADKICDDLFSLRRSVLQFLWLLIFFDSFITQSWNFPKKNQNKVC